MREHGERTGNHENKGMEFKSREQDAGNRTLGSKGMELRIQRRRKSKPHEQGEGLGIPRIREWNSES